MINELYTVEMLRYGDREAHSYIEGVYSDEKLAHKNGKAEKEWRGGNKYEYHITRFVLNEGINEKKVVRMNRKF